MLDGRVSLIADWYNRNTSDLLVQRPIPSTSGYTSDLGQHRRASATAASTSACTRSTSSGRRAASAGRRTSTSRGTATRSRRCTTASRSRSPSAAASTSIVAVGQPLGEFYLYKFLRVDPANGNAVFATADGGETESPTSADLMFVGSPQPKYYGGFTNTFTLRRLRPARLPPVQPGEQGVQHDAHLHRRRRLQLRQQVHDRRCTRWQKPGDITDEPRMSYDGTSGARLHLEPLRRGRLVRPPRRGHARLQASRRAWRARRGMDNARLYVSGRNLKTWTKYIGLQPRREQRRRQSRTS